MSNEKESFIAGGQEITVQPPPPPDGDNGEPGWLVRLRKEQKERAAEAARLAVFLDDESVDADPRQQDEMHEQLRLMNELVAVLGRRIKLAENPQ